jgi:hypothetical protein
VWVYILKVGRGTANTVTVGQPRTQRSGLMYGRRGGHDILSAHERRAFRYQSMSDADLIKDLWEDPSDRLGACDEIKRRFIDQHANEYLYDSIVQAGGDRWSKAVNTFCSAAESPGPRWIKTIMQGVAISVYRQSVMSELTLVFNDMFGAALKEPVSWETVDNICCANALKSDWGQQMLLNASEDTFFGLTTTAADNDLARTLIAEHLTDICLVNADGLCDLLNQQGKARGLSLLDRRALYRHDWLRACKGWIDRATGRSNSSVDPLSLFRELLDLPF